jgi:hypothetical protein
MAEPGKSHPLENISTTKATPSNQGEIPMAVSWLNDNGRHKIVFADDSMDDDTLRQRQDLRSEFKDKFPNVGKKFVNADGVVDFNIAKKAWKPTSAGTSYDFERDNTGDIKDYSMKQAEATPEKNNEVTEHVPEGQSVFNKLGGVSSWYNKSSSAPATKE